MDKNLLTWRNSGYKKNDCTVNRLIHIVNIMFSHLDTKEDSCMVNHSKAFDRIHHGRLRYKMQTKGTAEDNCSK